MLASQQRMRRSADFSAAVRHGRRGVSATVVVHGARATASQTSPLVGFVVSRGVGSSVVRNRVKRQLREIVRQNWPQIPPGSRLVVRATPAAAQADHDRLRSDLTGALARAVA